MQPKQGLNLSREAVPDMYGFILGQIVNFLSNAIFSKNDLVTHPTPTQRKKPKQMETIETYCSFSFNSTYRLLMIRLLHLALQMTVDITNPVANKVLK